MFGVNHATHLICLSLPKRCHLCIMLYYRRCDCLRQLVVVLCERGEKEQVVNFKYGEMEQEAVAILESRARSVDLTNHNYYDLLYAFHVFKTNFRKGLFYQTKVLIWTILILQDPKRREFFSSGGFY